MNSKVYKYCAVPMCRNTSIKTPQKLFVHVPNAEKRRNKWFELARRDNAPKSIAYFCEDHFDMPNDMENFMEYNLMGSVQIRMRPNCLPTKFICQPDRKRSSDSSPPTYPTSHKRQKTSLIEECMQDVELNQVVMSQECDDVPCGNSAPQHQIIDKGDKGFQVSMKVKYRSKSTQTEIKLSTKQNSPIKIPSTSVSTSPFKVSHIRSFVNARYNLSVSDNDVSSYIPSVSSPSLHSFQVSSHNSTSSNEDANKLKEEENATNY